MARLDAAIADLLTEERAWVVPMDGAPSDARPWDSSPFAALSQPLGLRPEQLRRACDAFNRRPEAERVAFFGLFVERRELEPLARAAGVSAVEVARQARAALCAALESASAASSEGERS